MAATEKMATYARVISEAIGIPIPNLEDFAETSLFIQTNAPVYKKDYGSDSIGMFIEAKKGELSESFVRFLEENRGFTGVYFLWSEETLLYIGKATKNGDRLASSIREKNRFKITHLSIIPLENIADVHILEPVLITENKPALNKEFKTSDTSVRFKSGVDVTSLKKVSLLSAVPE